MRALIAALSLFLSSLPSIAQVMPIWQNDTSANTLSFNDAFGHQVMVGSYDPGTGAWSIAPSSSAVSGPSSTNTFQLDTGTKTAAAVAGAATLDKSSGKITTEALTTAAGATYTLTLTDSQIAATDICGASLANGTNSTGDPAIGRVTEAAGSVVILVVNRHASVALNGTLIIKFWCLKG
jgi:hypothetical protein